MAQQQVLLIILGVCLLGIAISAGVIVAQKHDVSDAHEALIDDLYQLAERAQEYYQLSVGKRGGGGTFEGLFRVPDGIKLIAPDVASSTTGEYYLLKPVDNMSVQIVGVGKVPGKNPSHPVKVMITVWPNDALIAILN